MKYRAFAKVNLVLDIIGQRADGYHDLKMIMAALELHDLLTIELAEQSSFSSNAHFLDYDNNLIVNAIEKLREKYNFSEHFKVELKKTIPIQAGLGGGSANAAATIIIVNKLLNLKMSRVEMEEIAEQLGSDVKFCLDNKVSLVEGTGQKIKRIDNISQFYLLLVKPKKGISTTKAFSKLKEYDLKHYQTEEMVQALETNNYQKIIKNLGNSFEEVAFDMVPTIKEIKKELLEFGFDGALLSGSGSTVFAITKDKELLLDGVDFFRKKYPFVWATKLKEQ